MAFASFYRQDNAGDKIILRIGRVTTTEYELEKNLAIFSTDFTQRNGHSPVATDIKNWIQSFIDRTYFLADAWEKGYDTSREVNNWVQSMEHYVISRKGGLLDEKTDSGAIASNKQAMQPAWYDQVKKETQIKISPGVLAELENYRTRTTTIRTFEKSSFASLLTTTLVTYTVSGQSINVTTGRFMDYYNTLPIRKVIKDAEELVSYIESMVYDAVAYSEAEELGITKGVKFILDRENYKKNVIWASYETKELRAGITVSEEEISEKYGEIKDSLTEATDMVVSSYSLASRREAIMALAAVRNRKGDTLLNATVIDHHRGVNYRDTFFSDSIKAVIFSLKNNDVSMPLSFNGRFVLVLKESEAGRRIKAMPEVRNRIIKEIENEKLEYKKRGCLSRLKTLFSVQDEIDYDKYLVNVHK